MRRHRRWLAQNRARCKAVYTGRGAERVWLPDVTRATLGPENYASSEAGAVECLTATPLSWPVDCSWAGR